MAYFPRTFHAPDASFTPLFRLLDDFDNYSRGGHEGGRHKHQSLRTFTPKFDVRETEDSYELHGELPGIDRENVQIEFTEPQTLIVSGRVERTYSSGTPPAGLVQDAPVSGAITQSGEDQTPAPSHTATVEDEATEAAKETQSTEVAAKPAEEKPQPPGAKYWVSERSVGEFSRTFNFPTRIDQEAVSANLNNGILTVTVPKAKKHESRRITVN